MPILLKERSNLSIRYNANIDWKIALNTRPNDIMNDTRLLFLVAFVIVCRLGSIPEHIAGVTTNTHAIITATKPDICKRKFSIVYYTLFEFADSVACYVWAVGRVVGLGRDRHFINKAFLSLSL